MSSRARPGCCQTRRWFTVPSYRAGVRLSGARSRPYQTFPGMHNLWIKVWRAGTGLQTGGRATGPEPANRPNSDDHGMERRRARRRFLSQGTRQHVEHGADMSGQQHQPGAGSRSRTAEDLVRVWAQLLENLPPNQRAWLAASKPLALHENNAIIAVGDEFTRNRLEGRLRTWLEDALGAAFEAPVRLAVTVDPELPTLPDLDARVLDEDTRA